MTIKPLREEDADDALRREPPRAESADVVHDDPDSDRVVERPIGRRVVTDPARKPDRDRDVRQRESREHVVPASPLAVSAPVQRPEEQQERRCLVDGELERRDDRRAVEGVLDERRKEEPAQEHPFDRERERDHECCGGAEKRGQRRGSRVPPARPTPAKRLPPIASSQRPRPGRNGSRRLSAVMLPSIGRGPSVSSPARVACRRVVRYKSRDGSRLAGDRDSTPERGRGGGELGADRICACSMQAVAPIRAAPAFPFRSVRGRTFDRYRRRAGRP